MAKAARDENRVTTLMGVSSADGTTPIVVKVDASTGAILVDTTGSSGGDVVGPASSTDNAIARFDSTTGLIIQNSGVIIGDTDNVSGIVDIAMTGSLGTTGARVVKGWFTDFQVTNAIAGSITGNAGTVTTITGLAPDTATTQATQASITTTANLTTVGALDAGSITSNFGTINNGASDILTTGSLGSTGSRLTKGWFTDLQATNAIAGSVTGNAGTVTTITGLAPDTATTQAAQGNITSLGTLTALTVDDITINGNTVSSAGASTLAINPTAGQAITFDSTITLDAGVIAGATSVTSTAFVGDLTGNADTVTTNANLTGIVTSVGNGTAIADKAIAIAKLADGTDGELITWSATGVIAAVAVGTVGQVLTSGGVGVAPTFQAAAGGGDVSKVGTPVNSQVGVWTGDGTIEGATSFTYDGSNLQITGDIGATGTRITKGWFADLQVTNAIAGSVTGNAATVTTITGLAPDTATTQATQASITTTANLTTVGTLSTGNATAIVDASSVTVAGKVELATTAEIDTGTDSTRAMPTDQFVASKRNIRWLAFNVVDRLTDCSVLTNVGGDFVSPIAGTILQSDTTPFYLYATNSTAGTTGTMVVDIHLAGTTIMTTNKLDFDTTEKTTTTAATPPDLTDTTIAVGDILTIDIDAIHTTAAKGLTVYMAVRE